MKSNAVTPRDGSFLVSVDLVAVCLVDDHIDVLLERRNHAPLRGRSALPRTMLGPREDLDGAAARLIAELGAPNACPGHQIGAFAAPRRDPSGRVLGVGWMLLVPQPWKPPARHRWVPTDEALDARLGFDHTTVLQTALARLGDDLETTAIATELCPDPFTLAQLRAVYETVWGIQLDAANFHRRFTSPAGLLEPTGQLTSGSRGRPAMLYRRVGDQRLPMRFSRP